MKIGPEVEGFSVGDQVFSMADNTYAELCVVSAAILVKDPGARFDPSGGAAAGDDNGQPAPFGYGNQGGPDGFGRRRCGKSRAFGDIHRQGTWGDCDRGGLEEAGGCGEDCRRGPGGRNGRRHSDCEPSAVRCGGGYGRRKSRRKADREDQARRSVRFGSQGAAERREVPGYKGGDIFSKFDRKTFEFMAEAVLDGKLVIPISQTLLLRQAAEAQAAAEKGVAGKILLVA